MFEFIDRQSGWNDDEDRRSSSSTSDADEADRFSDEEEESSWKSITPTGDDQNLNAEFGMDLDTPSPPAPPPRRKMETMGIMMGASYDDDEGSNLNRLSCCNRYWYLWLCGTVVAIILLLTVDGMRQYQKQVDLLKGGKNGLDDFDIAQCNVFNGSTLKVVEERFNKVNDTSVFCQQGKLDKCHCRHPFQADQPDAHQAQWEAARKMNKALIASHSKRRLDVVMLGDSIVEHLAGRNLGYKSKDWKPNKVSFDKLFTKAEGGKVDGIPLGVGGDRIHNLLYRLQTGEAPMDFHPKVWWILIGTNDLEDACSADSITVGIFHLVDELRKFHPGSKIVLNSILPRNDASDLESSPTWEIIQEINLKLECYSNTAFNVDFFNATGVFTYKGNGKHIVNPRHFTDQVHPNGEGTRLWGEAIVDRVVELKDKIHHSKGHHHGRD